MLAAKYDIPSTSTGATLRREREQKTELGREAERWTAGGELAPDELILRIVRKWMDAQADGFLFDGFPRTLGQAQAFEEELHIRGLTLDGAIHFDVSDSEIRRRVLDRLTCGQCGATYSAAYHALAPGSACPACRAPLVRREDDTEATLARRMTEYRSQTLPVVAFYRDRGTLFTLDASAGREKIFSLLCQYVEGSPT